MAKELQLILRFTHLQLGTNQTDLLLIQTQSKTLLTSILLLVWHVWQKEWNTSLIMNHVITSITTADEDVTLSDYLLQQNDVRKYG